MLGWAAEVSTTLLFILDNCVSVNDTPSEVKLPFAHAGGTCAEHLHPASLSGLSPLEQWAVALHDMRVSDRMHAQELRKGLFSSHSTVATAENFTSKESCH